MPDRGRRLDLHQSEPSMNDIFEEEYFKINESKEYNIILGAARRILSNLAFPSANLIYHEKKTFDIGFWPVGCDGFDGTSPAARPRF